jgi:hypothetical protein
LANEFHLDERTFLGQPLATLWETIPLGCAAVRHPAVLDKRTFRKFTHAC